MTFFPISYLQKSVSFVKCLGPSLYKYCASHPKSNVWVGALKPFPSLTSEPTAAVLPSLRSTAPVWGFLPSSVPCRKGVASYFQVQAEIPLGVEGSSPVRGLHTGLAVAWPSVRLSNVTPPPVSWSYGGAGTVSVLEP